MPLNYIPTAGQTLVATRDPIYNNFVNIDAAFIIDHVDYQDPSGNQGMHAKVTFQTGAPGLVFPAGFVGLYNAPNPGTANNNELFINRVISYGTGNATNPVTASVISNSLAPANSNGWSYLPSGIYLSWGVMTQNGIANNIAYNYPTPGEVFNVQVSPQTPNAIVAVTGVPDHTHFNVNCTINGAGAAVTFYYLVIGR